MKHVGEVAAVALGITAMALGGPAGLAIGAVGLGYAMGTALTMNGAPLSSAKWVVVSSQLPILRIPNPGSVAGAYLVEGPFMLTEAQWCWYSSSRTAAREMDLYAAQGDVPNNMAAEIRLANISRTAEVRMAEEEMVKAGWRRPCDVKQSDPVIEKMKGNMSYYILTVAKAQAAAVEKDEDRIKLGLT
jgi:hypothetical protein